MNKAVKEYHALSREGESSYLHCSSYFGSCIICKPGCSDCCVNIAVFPVEWYAIELWLAEQNTSFRALAVTPGHCVFLKNRCCSIYPVRPLICRVHGVPLLYRTEDEDFPAGRKPDQPQYQITWCEYNFQDLSPEAGAKEINPETVIDLEDLNTRLAEINYLFLRTAAGAGYSLKQRYTINRMYQTWEKRHWQAGDVPESGDSV